ncbi:MAG: hypothetical protein HS115_06350 [Spirochaetales bacterium]|nr:hypothetical protein [Spirochaetales bacterium]
MKRLVLSVLGVALFFSFSIRLVKDDSSGKGLPLPVFSDQMARLLAAAGGQLFIRTNPGDFTLVIGSLEKLMAAENAWGFVRGSAQWANNNSIFADNIIVSLKNSGLLKNSGTISFSGLNINGTSHKLKLITGNDIAVSSSAYTGTKTFSNRLVIWNASDTKVFELLFDDISSSSGDGVLMNYRMCSLDPSICDNSNVIVESYISGSAGSRRQTYSWGAQLKSDNTFSTDRGRVFVNEMPITLASGSVTNNAICVRIVTRMTFAAAPTSISANCTNAGSYYYAMGYGQRTDAGLEATALFSFTFNAIDSNTTNEGNVCGSAHTLRHGIFNAGGFVQDGVTAASIPATYPQSAALITNNFSKTGAAGDGGAGGYDDTQKTTIDNLSAITFRSADTPP